MLRSQRAAEGKFRFGETTYKAIKILKIPCRIKDVEVEIETTVVEGDIPWILGRNSISDLEIIIDIRKNEVRMKGERISCNMIGDGHMRMKLRRRKKELSKEWWVKEWIKDEAKWKQAGRKLHLQFGHGSGEKLEKIVKEAFRNRTEEQKRVGEFCKVLKRTCEECEICRRLKRNPKKPIVGMKFGEKFNEVVAIDLGEVEGHYFLIMVDHGTHYSQGGWIGNKTPKEVIRVISEKWLSYFGSPKIILSDNGGEFQNEEFYVFAERFGIELRATPSESPWSNGICEKWVGLTKDGLRKLKEEGIPRHVALAWTIAAKNSLIMKGGFAPNQLVFGRNTGVINLYEEATPVEGERGGEEEYLRSILEGRKLAREIHIQQESEDKIRRALGGKIREHKVDECEIGDKVYYKREKEKRWRGPAIVIGKDGKTVIVKHGGSLREVARIHITRIKKEGGVEEEEVKEGEENDRGEGEEEEDEVVRSVREESEDEDEREDEGEVVPVMRKGERYEVTHRREGRREAVEILSRAGKATSKKWSDSYNIRNIENGEVGWRDMRDYRDFRKIPEEEEVFLGNFEDSQVLESKLKEIESWVSNGVFERVKNVGQKTVSTRWIITEKMKNGNKICKARLVARGFEEKGGDLTTEAPTCAAETLKICVAKIVERNWKIHSLDIKTAYLQGDEMKRVVYLKPPVEAKEGKVVWKLRKTVYGLKDAARAWYDSATGVIEKLGGRRCRMDPSLFYWEEEKKLMGLLCSHVDDFFFGGTEKFHKEIIGELKKRLEVGSQETESFRYIGVELRQEKGGVLMEQRRYIEGIKNIKRNYLGDRRLSGEEETVLRSLLGQLNWTVQHTRPDLACGVSLAGQIEGERTGRHLRRVVKMVEKAKENPLSIKMEKMEGEISIETYTDASFGSGGGGASQVGYIVALVDERGKRCPIYWKSRKGKRVARSTIEAEAIGLNEGLEMALYVEEIWRELSGGGRIKIKGKTDSRTLERAIKSSTNVSSKRLRIDLARIKEMVRGEEIEEIEWVAGSEQVADGLTKEGGRIELLRSYVGEGEGKREG